MNPLPDFAFWLRTLGVPALQVTALLAVAGLLTAKLRSARNQRAAWLAAFTATGLLVAASFFGADRELAAWLKPKPAPEHVIRVRTNLPVDGTSAAPLPASAGEVTLSSVASEPRAIEAVVSPQPVWWPAWLWLAGGAALIGRKLIWRGVFAWWWRSRQGLAGPELGAHVAEVARRLSVSGRVRVIASPALVCPIAFGVLRPTVGLPADFAAANGTREREAMLAHELAHLSARDPLWLGLADLVAAVLWWHPLVWWARRQLRAACETAADEASVLVEDGPAVLANCLVTLAAQLPRRRAFGLLGMAGFRSDLGRRVERLLALRNHGLQPTAHGRLVLAAIGGTTIAVALALASTAWALPRSAGEQPTLLALAEQAVAQADLPGTDPAGAALPAPASKPASAVPSPSADDPRQQWQQWQATLLLQLSDTNPSDRTSQTLACIDALLRRLYATRQFTSVKVEPVEPNRIQVFLRMKDTNGWGAVKTLVERRGELEFRRVHPASDELVRQGQCPTGYEVLGEKTGPGEAARPYVVARLPVKGLTSREIAQAEAKINPLDSKPRVLVTFTPEGATAFQNLTREAIGQKIAVVVDGELLMAPIVNEEIAVGACEISGRFSMNEAGRLAALLQIPLPTQLKLVSGTVFGPSVPGGSPDARAATTPVEPASVISIWVTAGGQILFAGRETTLEAVRGELEKAKASAPDLVVRLIADTRTPMNRLVEVLDKCREAGITRISLHTIDTTRPATNAPPTSSISPPAKSTEGDASARAATLVQDGKILFEMGKLDEASVKLREAVKIDPENLIANHYFALVMNQKLTNMVEVETAWRPRPSPPAQPPSPLTWVEFPRALHQYFWKELERTQGAEAVKSRPIETLREYFAAAGAPFDGTNVLANPSDGRIIAFQNREGKALLLDSRTGDLTVRTTPADFQKVQNLLDPAGSLVMEGKELYELGKFDEAKAKLESALKLEPDNDAARYYLKRVGEAEAAKAKNGGTQSGTPYLPPSSGKTNRLEEIKFDPGAEQGAVAKILAKPVTLHLENTTLQDILSEVGRAEGVNFVSDQPLSAFQQRLSINLEQVTFQELLSYLSRNLDVQFQVGDKLVRVVDGRASASTGPASGDSRTDDNQLFTRTFKVNPETLRQSLEAVAGNVPTNQPPAQLLRSFLAAAGLDLGGTNAFAAGAAANGFQSQSGKAVFYNDRNGMLLVRATARDLQTVETALQMLNTSPPQVVIEAKFVEVTMDDNKALGFDWYLGNTLMTTNGPVATDAAGTTNGVATITGLIKTDPQFRSVVEALQRGGTNGVHDLRGDELDWWPGREATNAHNVRVTAALGASMTGVLTDPQYRAVLRALEQRSGADVLSAPRVTTVSGRQAQIQVADMRTVVNGIDPTALIQLGAQPRTNAVPFLTSTIPVGPTLDIIPTVAADGYTIELNVIASTTEFLGYDQAPANAKVTVWQGGKASEVAVPLPRFRVRQMTTKARIWDGQTLVLAGMPVEDSVTMKDKVPVLGDLPAVGGLFRSESKGTVKKNLIVFITATIIDPAGNRVHSADNPPYDPARVPPQATR